MKVTGTILHRYYNLPKMKGIGRVGQASRLRYTGRAQSYASRFKVIESSGRHSCPKQNLECITRWPGNTERIYEKRWIKRKSYS